MTMALRFAMALVLLALSTVCFASQDHAVEHSVGANDDLRLEPKQVHEFEIAGLGGDATAASRLALYYGFYLKDQANELKWLTIAAENGDVVSQCNLGKLMGRSTEVAMRQRSTFWAAKCQKQ